MPYNRTYSLNEIHDTLWESERRLRPSAPARYARPGHAISGHADGRRLITDRPDLPQDTRFLSRKDLVKVVHAALNSPAGQVELARLMTVPTVEIIARPTFLSHGRLTAQVCRNAVVEGKEVGSKKRWVSAVGPPLVGTSPVTGVYIVVDRLPPPNPDYRIHIQTAFPLISGDITPWPDRLDPGPSPPPVIYL